MTTDSTISPTLPDQNAPATTEQPMLNFGDAWEYAPAPESVPVDISDAYGLFINGKFTQGKELFDTINPATEKPLAKITEGDRVWHRIGDLGYRDEIGRAHV